MEYSIKDVLSWTFTHPNIKSAIENYEYLYFSLLGDPSKSTNGDFLEALKILRQISSIGNPAVCSGMFTNAGVHFNRACKQQLDEEKLLSYLGQMFCNHWAGQDYQNLSLQQEISRMEYQGSFWERHGDKFIALGSAALAGIGMICGAPPTTATGSCAKGARGLLDNHSQEYNVRKNKFEKFRNAILALKF